MFGVPATEQRFFYGQSVVGCSIRVDRKRLYVYKRGIFGGFRSDLLKVDMSTDDDAEC